MERSHTSGCAIWIHILALSLQRLTTSYVCRNGWVLSVMRAVVTADSVDHHWTHVWNTAKFAAQPKLLVDIMLVFELQWTGSDSPSLT